VALLNHGVVVASDKVRDNAFFVVAAEGATDLRVDHTTTSIGLDQVCDAPVSTG
jgi:hypothetical protein